MSIRGYHGLYFAIVFIVCMVFLPSRGMAQFPPAKVGPLPPPPLTLDQVVDNLIRENVKRFTALQGYQCRRTYKVVYHGFLGDLHAEMVVDLDYIAPDTKNFKLVSESGSKFLVDHILKKVISVEAESQQAKNRKALLPNRENYNFTHLEYQPASDGCSYVISVQPVVPNKLLYRGRIWVNDRDFAICRIEGAPSKTPSFWITSGELTHRYVKIGEFWFSSEDKSVSTIRLGGTATLTIQYADYKIRTASAPAKPASSAPRKSR